MKNVSQTVQVKAFTLVTQNAVSAEIQRKIAQAEAMEDSEEKTALLAEVHKDLSPTVKEELKAIGTDSMIADIDLSLSLGDFFFDLLMSARVQPQAPLKLAYFQKQIQELADRLQGDEISVLENDLTQLRSILDNDEKWAKVRINAAIDMENATKEAISLTPRGVTLFSEILASSIEVFDKQKEEFEKGKKEKKEKKEKKAKSKK